MTAQLENLLNLSITWAITDGVKLAIGLIVLSVGWKFIKKLIKFMNSLMEKKHVDKTLRNFLDAFIEITLKIILIMASVYFD